MKNTALWNYMAKVDSKVDQDTFDELVARIDETRALGGKGLNDVAQAILDIQQAYKKENKQLVSVSYRPVAIGMLVWVVLVVCICLVDLLGVPLIDYIIEYALGYIPLFGALLLLWITCSSVVIKKINKRKNKHLDMEYLNQYQSHLKAEFIDQFKALVAHVPLGICIVSIDQLLSVLRFQQEVPICSVILYEQKDYGELPDVKKARKNIKDITEKLAYFGLSIKPEPKYLYQKYDELLKEKEE